MECCIAGVVPVAGNWSGECCIAVRQLLAGKTVTVKLVDMLEHGRIHTVDILLAMGRVVTELLKSWNIMMWEVQFVMGKRVQEFCGI